MSAKILIVEDDNVGRLLLRRILKADPSFEIHEAQDGLAAWDLFQKGVIPHVCLLDIMMPRMDGLDLLVRMRSEPRLRGIKVIMVTAVNDRPRVTQATSLDIDGYILKPFSAKRVLDQIRSVLQPHTPPVLPPLILSQEKTQGFEWNTYANGVRLANKETELNLDALRAALASGDRGKALEQTESMKQGAQKLGLTALVNAANRLGAAILLDDIRNITSGFQAVDAARKEMLETISKLEARKASGGGNPPPGAALRA